jgi:predicted transcriptional regulator
MCHLIQHTSFFIFFSIQADVAEVLQILEKKKLTSLPVLVNGKFSGFVGESICFLLFV